MTISEHISIIRHLIKEHVDDSYYNDELIYKFLINARSLLLEREAKKWTKFSDFVYQTFCMPLVLDKFHDCNCLPYDTDCYILKSKYEIPKTILGRNRLFLNVMTIEGEPLSYFFDISKQDHFKYSKTKKNKLRYTISNNKLIIIGSTQLKTVLVKLVAEDPLDLSKINLCDEDGNESNNYCYNILQDEFPIEAALHIPMYEETLKLLNIPLQLKEDIINDTLPNK